MAGAVQPGRGAADIWAYDIVLAWILLSFIPLAGRPLIRGARRLDGTLRNEPDPSTANLLMQNWSMTLCHVADVARTDDLLRSTLRHVRQVAGSAEAILCRTAGITTADTRTAAIASVLATAIDDDLLVLWESTPATADHTPPVRSDRHLLLRGWWLFLLFGLAYILAFLAPDVAVSERSACAAARPCASHLTTYGGAAKWLLVHRFIVPLAFLPDSPPPLTPDARRDGWSALFAGLLASGTFAWSVWSYVKVNNQAMEARQTRLARTIGQRSRVLVLTVTDQERDSVMAAVAAAQPSPVPPAKQFLQHHTVWPLGTLGKTAILLGQSGPGTLGPGAMILTARSLIAELRPTYVLVTGTCVSLRPSEHAVGDVLVADQLSLIDARREVDQPVGAHRVIIRGDRPSPSPTLLDRCHAATYAWHGVPVRFGLLLSSNSEMGSRAARRMLADLEPDAIGHETESAGVYAAAVRGSVDWIAVVGVSDVGDGRDADALAKAASNAAKFVIHVIVEGGLHPLPSPVKAGG